jgi:cell division initiation protein
MRLTPLDIQQMVFKVNLRGYDRQDVQRFLEDVALTVEGLNRENQTLKERLSHAEEQLSGLKKAEATLTHTLVSTQALADELKQAAHRDAELIMKEAEMKASALLQAAREELVGTQREILDMRKQRLMAIERLRSTLRSFERMLEIEEEDQDQPDPPDQAEKMAEAPHGQR